KVFEIRGRKAVLTPTGEVLYRRGKTLVDEAARLEPAAGELAKGWEAEIRIAVEILFPTWLLVQCLGAFSAERPDTRIELYETVLGGTDEALAARRVDFAISPNLPAGFLGDPLMPLRPLCVARPSHPLPRLCPPRPPCVRPPAPPAPPVGPAGNARGPAPAPPHRDPGLGIPTQPLGRLS